jgi:hypothetical protein
VTVPSSDHAASLTIASWHRWDKRRIRYWVISAHIPSTSAWNHMGEGAGSRLDVEATNDPLRAYDRNHGFSAMAGMPKMWHSNDRRTH